MRRLLLVLVVVALFVAGTVGAAKAVDALTTGTVSACASTPAQTIDVNGSPVSTLPGDSECATTTYTIPTVTDTTTETTTVTVPSTTTTPTTTTTPNSPWSSLVNVDFSTEPDGYSPFGWCHYAGKDNVFGQGYYDPAHVYVKGGLLHLLSSYESNGPNGAGWYTGAVNFKGSTCGGSSTGPFGFSAHDSQMTVRMRLVESGTRAEGHRNIIFWPDQATGGNDYATYGEEDMWESDVGLSNASMFLHYWNGSPAQVAWTYPTSWSWSDWHTYRFVNLNGVISAYIDGALVRSYTCTSTTCPARTASHWVLQQQMHAAGGTPAANGDAEDWQVSSIQIDKAQ